jgi:hypothetical protein
MPAARRCILILTGCLLAVAPALRGQIMSVSDPQFTISGNPFDASEVMEIDRRGANGLWVLADSSTRLYAGSFPGSRNLPDYHLYAVPSDFVAGLELSLGPTSAVDPLNPSLRLFASYVGFTPTITVFPIDPPNAYQTFLMGSPSDNPGTVTFSSNGSLYYFQDGQGIRKLDYAGRNAATHTMGTLMTFGTSGAGALTSSSFGLVATNDAVYALDLPNNRVVRFDSGTGAYLGDFAVTGAHADSDLAVSANGRAYVSNGNGGGTIYDAVTGAVLDTFLASSTDTGNTGRDVLYLDEEYGYLYTFDQATGFHVFYDPASISAVPEPSTTVAALAGVALLAAAWRRREARQRSRGV